MGLMSRGERGPPFNLAVAGYTCENVGVQNTPKWKEIHWSLKLSCFLFLWLGKEMWSHLPSMFLSLWNGHNGTSLICTSKIIWIINWNAECICKRISNTEVCVFFNKLTQIVNLYAKGIHIGIWIVLSLWDHINFIHKMVAFFLLGQPRLHD